LVTDQGGQKKKNKKGGLTLVTIWLKCRRWGEGGTKITITTFIFDKRRKYPEQRWDKADAGKKRMGSEERA